MANRREVIAIAGDAGVDPGAAARALAGKRVRHATLVLVEQSARKLGLAHLLPATPAPAERAA